MRLNRREMLDHLHTLAHHISGGRLPLFEHEADSSGTKTVFTIAVDRAAYWRLVSKTQDLRDALRRRRSWGGNIPSGQCSRRFSVG